MILGQRWRYVDSKFDLVIEVTREDGTGIILQSNDSGSCGYYACGKECNILEDDETDVQGNGWRLQLLLGQNKP